ncbi:MAG TPA: hypothetical protein VNU68_18120 [Verrucomicrobiae bacterium]|jgi:preprotein translocase subunit SecD|nr:hypothetical protein [Verrucomicrobiae bacterium]
MKIRFFRFNTYLAFGLCAVLTLAGGCLFSSKKKEKEKEISKQDLSSLRLYLEVNADGSDRNGAIAVGRQAPFTVNVEKKSFLTEFNIEKASVVDSYGGFSISIRYDKEGSWILEQYTTANKGKRIAIAAEFGSVRWLAAPVIQQRIGDGLLVFTPDATRQESERIVKGLNHVAELIRKGQM